MSTACLLAVIAPLALVGPTTGSPEAEAPGPQSEYVPTKVGTRWVYEVSGDERAVVTESVTAVEEKQGVRHATIRVVYKHEDPRTRTPLTVIANRKVWSRRDGVFTETWWSDPGGLCLLRLPPSPGTAWEEGHP